MKNEKRFDCVAMKQTIQDTLCAELATLTPEERHREEQRRIENDPVLGDWLKRVRSQAHARGAARR